MRLLKNCSTSTALQSSDFIARIVSQNKNIVVSKEDLAQTKFASKRRRLGVFLSLVLLALLCSIGAVLVVREYQASTPDVASQQPDSPPVPDFNQTKMKADQGDAAAQNLLGELYLNGQGVRPDSKAAAEWFTRSAQQGHGLAQLNLGMLFEAGQGVAVDYAQAVEWYRKAAEQGLPGAQYSLAVTYAYARGVPRDDREALKWLRRAAEQGHGLSEYALAHRYIAGLGVPQDLAEAFKWLTLAASQNITDSETVLAEIKPKMSRDQIAEGRKRAQQFRAQGPSADVAK
jgi:TPR repeat protein